MRKYLLSLMVVVIGITLVGATTYAYESESIQNENTFEFYENEFDFLLMPAKLAGQDSTLGDGHKLVEGFTGYRLFTNLTNQAGADAYQIGGIIPIPGGMGNIGILFDYRNNEGGGIALDCVNCGTTYRYGDFNEPEFNGSSWSSFSGDGFTSSLFEEINRRYDSFDDDSPYDGVFKDTYTNVDNDSDDFSEDALNFYFGYGLPIPNTPVSVGISYAYAQVDGNTIAYDNSNQLTKVEGELTTPRSYDAKWATDSESEWEYETHEVALEGRFNQSPIDALLGFAWRGRTDGMNTDSYGYSYDDSAIGTNMLPYGTYYLTSNQVYSTYNSTYTTNNEDDNFFPFCGYGNREGDRWSIYAETIFELNPTVAFGLDLAYHWADYDDKLEGVDVTAIEESGRVAGSGVTPGYTYDSRDTWDLDGDIESDEFYTRAELRLTFPQVLFGLGISYDSFQEDGDYDGTFREGYTLTYSDGDTQASDPDDYTTVSSESTEHEAEYQIDKEIWRFPVATEFNITDRLVCRLGVEFVFGDWELEMESKETENADESVITTYGDGTKGYGPVNKASTAYDDDYAVTEWSVKDSDTYSDTIYNVGLGYQVTENLDVDAMWRHHTDDHQDGETTKREGVSTDMLFVGATLAF